jgi:hypothetical protein
VNLKGITSGQEADPVLKEKDIMSVLRAFSEDYSMILKKT